MTDDLVLWVRRDLEEWTVIAVIPWDRRTSDRIYGCARRAARGGWREMAVLWPSTETRPAVDHRLTLMPGLVLLAGPPTGEAVRLTVAP